MSLPLGLIFLLVECAAIFYSSKSLENPSPSLPGAKGEIGKGRSGEREWQDFLGEEEENGEVTLVSEKHGQMGRSENASHWQRFLLPFCSDEKTYKD